MVGNEVIGVCSGAKVGLDSSGVPSEPSPHPEDPLQGRGTSSSGAPEQLGLLLGGKLLCVGCGYNLQGVSIRGVCPECGLAVRGTILATVDPSADELQPMPAPLLTAAGLIAWSLGAIIGVLFSWIPRILDVLERVGWGGTRFIRTPEWIGEATFGAICVSAIGSLALLRPTRNTKWWGTALALVSFAAYAPLAYAVWRIQEVIDPGSAPPYLVGGPQPDRLMMRAMLNGSLLVILLGLRANARVLVERSLALRTGRVDRQTILAMALVVVVAGAGDGLWGWSVFAAPSMQDILQDSGSVLVAVGSLLFTMGVASGVQDSIRIARAILSPAPGLRQVLRGSA